MSLVLNELADKYIAIGRGHFAFTVPRQILAQYIQGTSGAPSMKNLLLAIDKVAFVFVARHINYRAKSIHWPLIVTLLSKET